MLLISNNTDDVDLSINQLSLEDELLDIQYLTKKSGKLSLVTIFLLNEWVGANASLKFESGNPILVIEKGERILKQVLE